jgi:sirohydrochlorin cobaltochelatase
MSRHLILFAHGSRDPRWRQPFEGFHAKLLAEQGASAAQPPFSVHLAYMEMTSPTLGEVVDAIVAEGGSKLVVLPMFMAAGAHLAHDLPRLLEEVAARHPGVEIQALPPLGEHPAVVEAMLRVAQTVF